MSWLQEMYSGHGMVIYKHENPFIAINYYPPYKATKGSPWVFNISETKVNWQVMPDTIDNIEDAKQYAMAIARLEG